MFLLCLSLLLSQAPPAPTGRDVDRTALWERSGEDILHSFHNMYQFRVVHDPADQHYPFRAWFFGWAAEDGNPGYSGCDAIYMARSRELESGWEVYTGAGEWDATMDPSRWVPVITARDEPFDEWHNGDPSVVRVGGRFFMAYSSTGHNLDGKLFGHPDDTDGSILCVMGASSGDGIRWRKSEMPILLRWEDLGDAPVPQGESHLFGSYHRPSLLYDAEERKFRLWFDYWAGQDRGVAMGYAENVGDFLNPDDWHIIRAGDDPCLPHFPNPNVIRVGDHYLAYADPPVPVGEDASHPWRARKITEAVSNDGLEWTILGYIEPDADAPAIHVPEALVWGEFIYLFYACQIGGETVYDYRYDRIRWMRRHAIETELNLP